MSMFWGLSMKPNRKYTQTIVKSFHISGVALDEGNSAKFYITADKNKFIVATLNKNQPQMTLDLNFCRGDKIMFQTTGDGTVSLIGYLHDAEDSDDEEFEDEEYAALAKSLGADGKAEEGSEEEGDDDDDEDDEDADDNKLAAEYSSFLEEEESGEEEEDDEEGESDDEEDEDDDDDDSDEEEVQPKAKKAKIAEQGKKPAKEQNGVAKNDQKQQQKSKKDKKAAAEPKKEQPKAKEAKQQPQQQAGGGERTITGGVKVQDLSAGSGPEAKQGKRVSVYYIGRLKSNNKTFDSMQKGNGFKFALGGGEVIKGWDVGVVGMKVGGKRRITCPAHMAYGARGHPPTIPPNSTLVFDVELKAVH